MVRRDEGRRLLHESGAWLEVMVTGPSPALVTVMGAADVPEFLMFST